MFTKNVFMLLIFMISGWMLLQSPVFAAESGDLLKIESLEVRDGYEPGNGLSVGKIRNVSGAVFIVHMDQNVGYRAAVDLDLFKNDLLVTGLYGSAAFRLNDGSFISVSRDTHMRISQSIYAPQQKTRSTFMNMIIGKARFVVKKFVDARHSEFKVKTKTSVAGVRGSDFIISASETITEIIALEQTQLAVISLTQPDAEPMILSSFERTEVRIGMLPEEAQRARSEDVDRMMKEFRFQPPVESIQQEMGLIAAAAVGTMGSGDEKPEKVYLPESEVTQQQMEIPLQSADGDNAMQRLFRSTRIRLDEQNLRDQNLLIYENIKEIEKKQPLPDFPGTP